MKTAIRILISGCMFIFALIPLKMSAQCGMTVNVQADPPPPYNVCLGETITLTAVVTGGVGPYSWLWSDGSTSQSITVTPPFYGNAYVFATDANGCMAEGYIHIKAWVMTVDIVYNPATICEGDSLLLAAWPDFSSGFTFLWSTGQTTQNIYVYDPGTYSVTATNPNGCSGSDSETVLFNPEPTPLPIITGPVSLCEGQNATLSVEGGPFAWYYWNDFSTEQTLDITGPGIYWVEVANATGCVSIDSIIILQGSPVPMLAGPSGICASQSGTISITNASEFADFIWSTGSTNSSIIVNNPGLYSVTVSDGQGCSASGSITIATNNPNIIIAGNITSVTTCLFSNGAIDVTVSPPDTYSFDWSNGAITQDLSNLSPGSYTITVTDDEGCTSSSTFFVALSVTTPFILSGITHATCGQNNGAIDLVVTPPAGVYTYLWSNGMTTQDLANISSGTYNVTVTGSNGCTATSTVIVNDNAGALTINGTITQPSTGQNNGAIDISVSPSGAYTYLWSNGATTQDLTGLAPGSYTVTVSAGGGCSETATFVLNAECDLTVTYTISPPLPFCAGEEITLTLIPAGGTAPYTYLWTNGATTQSITFTAQSIITLDGSVTDADGCMAQVFIHIKSSIWQVFIQGFPSTCGQNNGIVDLTVTGGSTYDFIWSNGATTEDLLNVSAGTYFVTVTGPDGCTATANATVIENMAALTVTGAVTQPTVGQNDGAIDLSVFPPGTYTYLWSNGATIEDLTGLAPGTYTVTVSAGSCTEITSFVLEDMIPCPAFDAFIADPIGNVFCIGESLTLTTFTIGGTQPFTYLWSTGGTGSTETITITGNIDVFLTVTDANGCTSTSSQHIKPLLWWADVQIVGDPVCVGEYITLESSFNAWTIHLWSTGETTSSIQVNAPGLYSVTITDDPSGCTTVLEISPTFLSGLSVGITGPAAICPGQDAILNTTGGPFNTYLWSPGGQITPDITVNEAGTYQVVVSNGTGCDGFEEITITENQTEPPWLFGTETICNGGSAEIEITNSTSYSSFIWNTGETTSLITVNLPGTYNVTVTSTDGCTAVGIFTVSNEPNTPSVTSIVTASTCSEENGSIDLTVSPADNYTFEWSNGANAEDQVNIPAGIYDVTVTSENGCTTSESINVPDDVVNISIDGTATPNTSCVVANGGIDVNVSPVGLYLYAWSNGESTEDLIAIPAGTYTVTITLGLTCVETATFIVENTTDIPELASTITQNDSCDQPNGTIDITISPAGTYTFLWSNGLTSEDLQQLSGGTYSLTVTSNDGCTISEVFEIVNTASGFSLAESITPSTSCVNDNGAIDITINPPGVYTIVWSNGATTEDLQNIAAGTYTVSVTDNLNCSSSSSFMVEDNTSSPMLSAVTSPASCGGNSGAVDLSVSPAGNNTFLWSNGEITEDLQSLIPGSYSVIVTDNNGCEVLDTFDVQNVNSNFSITAVPLENTSCVNPNGSIDLTITPAGTYVFSWSNGSITEDLININAGTYAVTVTDILSCSSTATFFIGNNAPGITISSSTSPATCGNDNGSILLAINPPATSFLWSNGATSEDLQNLAPGNYVVTITDLSGCVTIDSFEVPEAGSTFLVTAIPGANTNCVVPNGSIDLSVSPLGTYLFVWSHGSTSEDQSYLAQGIYTVTITDINGCSTTGSFVVENATNSPSLATTVTPETCGNANGQIDLTINPSGTYHFTWSNGELLEDLTDISAGTYSVTVTDDNGCTASTIVVVPDATSNFSISATTTNNTSCTGADGVVDLTVVPAGNYNFQWSTGATTEDLHSLLPGSYIVTVTDLANCSLTGSYSVGNAMIDLVVDGTITPMICGEPNGSIDLIVVPASGNGYSWSNGATSEDLENITEGTYSVTVTGPNGCTVSSSFVMPVSQGAEVEIAVDAVNAGDVNVTIRAQVNLPLSALDTIMWLPGDLFDCTQEFCLEQTIARPSHQTEIIVMVADTNGCTAQASLILEAEIDPHVFIPNVFSPNGDGINDMFTVAGDKDVEEIVELRIFDRWGTFVFLNTHFPPNVASYGWDGSFKNDEMQPAVFVYWAKVKFVDGSEDFFKGDVTLLR